jgi:hypothetical protein
MEEILCQLKELLAEHHQGFQPVGTLILQLANRLETNRKWETRRISTTIKHLLAENIKKGEISPRYIHNSLPEKFKRKYPKERELISHSKVDRIIRRYPSDHSITRRGKVFEICCSIDREHLQNVLNVIFPVLQERNPYLKIQFEPASGQLIEVAIGDQDDVSGNTWFCLFWDYKKS